MQLSSKNKIKYFSFGLTAGLTIGVVFAVAIKSLFGHINDVNLGILKLDSKQDQIAQRLDSIEGKIAGQDKRNTIIIPTVKENVKPPDQPVLADKSSISKDSNIHKIDGQDTIALTTAQASDDSNVVVMTNQLVSVANVPVTDLDSTSKRNKVAGQTDSAIASMNEVAQDIYPVNYRIEFWESPLNFKGYKMSLGKIILYGINSNTVFRLIKWDEGYYLVSNEDAYVVSYTDDARPFERVTDRSILKRFSL